MGDSGPDRLAKRHHKFPIHRGYGLGYAVSAAPRGTVVILIAASELCPTQCGILTPVLPGVKSAEKAHDPPMKNTPRSVWENKVVRVLRILNFCTYVNNSVLFIILSYYYYGALSEGTVVV